MIPLYSSMRHRHLAKIKKMLLSIFLSNILTRSLPKAFTAGVTGVGNKLTNLRTTVPWSTPVYIRMYTALLGIANIVWPQFCALLTNTVSVNESFLHTKDALQRRSRNRGGPRPNSPEFSLVSLFPNNLRYFCVFLR